MTHEFDTDEVGAASSSPFAAKARDLDALRGAVVDAASVGAGLWFSYIFVLLYLSIAVASVTHRDLFLVSPVKLPFLAVDLPLTAFFAVGPLLFVVIHAYVLLHFVLLAGKVGAFHRELELQIADEDVRTNLRRQLPSNIFAQFLAGPREVRSGVVGYLLRAIAWISLVFGPLALLVLFQLQFLPYHDEFITWEHRLLVLTDIILLWMLWPSIATGQISRFTRSDVLNMKIAAFAGGSALLLFLVFAIATFPGEWLDDNVPTVRFIPWDHSLDGVRNKSLHELLLVGDVDDNARRPTSPWSNRLVLPGLDVIDRAKFDTDAKIASVSHTVSLRARRLERAVLAGANLRKADFTGAVLVGTVFDHARLERAIFDGANLNGASLAGAKVTGARFSKSQMQGAVLSSSSFQAVFAHDADLRGASFNGADMAFAQLTNARLDGASLQRARLEGAEMTGASLSATSFDYAFLIGTDLSAVSAEAVDFANAKFWRNESRDYPKFKAVYLYSALWRPAIDPDRFDDDPNLASDRWNIARGAELRDLVKEYSTPAEQDIRLSFLASWGCKDIDRSFSHCKIDSPNSVHLRQLLEWSEVNYWKFWEARDAQALEIACGEGATRYLIAGMWRQKERFNWGSIAELSQCRKQVAAP